MIHRGTCSVTASVWKIERKKVTFSGAAHCQHERGGVLCQTGCFTYRVFIIPVVSVICLGFLLIIKFVLVKYLANRRIMT